MTDSSGEYHQPLSGRAIRLMETLSPDDRAVLERDPSARNALSLLADHSPGLVQLLSGHSSILTWLFLDKAYETGVEPGDLAARLGRETDHSPETIEALQAGLRRFRLKEMARLAIRDLTGRADLAEVVQTLSALADACLAAALQTAGRLTERRYGLPADKLGFSPVILGMGKLGAGELNYSSDVDLIYLYREEGPSPKGVSISEAAAHLFGLVTRALGELTADGFVFRVDLDLRPGGKDGAMAQSVREARNHYLVRGHSWERLAFLKAKPAAGDLAVGREFLEEIDPFVFRRHLDYTSIEEIRDLKARFSRENKARLGRPAGRLRPAVNVKLSPGGIREIEFFAQALTITFGGRLPHLRKAATREALAALRDEGLVAPADAAELEAAYVFLRTVEHRLQLRELNQTQSLPRDREVQDALGRSMGFSRTPWTEFESVLNHHMARVRHHHGLLLAEPGDRPAPKDASRTGGPEAWAQSLLDGLDDEKESRRRLGEAGFERPDAAYGVLRDIVRLRFLPDSLARYAAHVERMLPRLLYGMSRAADPDRAITQLGRFMVSIGPKAGFLVLLEENPRLIDLLAVLFSQSDLLAGVLIRHPAILDSLVDRRSAALVKSRADLAGELDQMLGPEDDLEAALLVIRRFRNDELLRVGLYDLLDKITWDQVQTQLADLAELILDRTMVLAARQVLPGRAPSDIPLSVLGLGKMGGRELWYGSDLDLIFVLDPEGDLPIESAVRLAQRLISYLSLHLDAGPGYSIDSRLRPSGGQGPLVVTADSFGRYHETSQLWERQALIKLRPVWGPEGLGDRVMALASRAVYDRGLPSDAAAQIHRIRHRMTKERAKLKPGQISLKFSPGGVVDAEFLTQYLQLTHGREHPGPIRSTRTRSALEALAQAGFGPPGLTRVAEAYPFLSHFSGRLGLSYDRSGDRAVYRPEEIDRIHPPLSGGSAARALERAMAQVAEAYALVFGGAQNGSGERP